MDVVLRPYVVSDEAAVLRLNTESVAVLSPMDGPRFRALSAMADMLQVADAAGDVVGFFVAFTDGREYDSVNYRWFAARVKRFLYIDRVALDPHCRGVGVGTQFYRLAEQHARTNGLAWLVTEVDVEPPNPASLAFHDRLGFVEVGRQVAGGKVVSLRVKSLDAEPNAAADRGRRTAPATARGRSAAEGTRVAEQREIFLGNGEHTLYSEEWWYLTVAADSGELALEARFDTDALARTGYPKWVPTEFCVSNANWQAVCRIPYGEAALLLAASRLSFVPEAIWAKAVEECRKLAPRAEGSG